ncbi:MAG TPA: hypothetical protein DCY00_01235 [Actinobacteria bacterium]|nr:hypothetical protein [Actinomycetota bacterium]
MAKAKVFFKKIGSVFISPEITNDSRSLNLFYKYFLGGILVRFLFMPFFFQRDLLSTYQRAADTVFNGNIGSDFQQLITNIIHSVYFLIMKTIFPFLNSYRDILLNQDTWISWVEFVKSDNIFLILTVFKFLYFIFDMACIFVILRLFYDGDAQKKLKIFKYWMFNPIVIFVLYLFARHDIIGLFVTLLAFLLAKKKRKYWAILVLAVAVAIRFFPIMVLPILIIYLAERKKDYFIMLAIGLSGLISIEAISYIAFGKSVIFSLLNAEHFNYIISSKIELIVHDRIFIFLVVYTIIILSFIKLKNKSFELLMSYCGIIYLSYVALSYFHPQYLLWSVPFVLYVAGKQKNLYYFQWIQFAFLIVVFIYWGDLITKFLFAPLDYKFFIYLPGPIPLINRFYDPEKFVNIFRSIFTGVSLWMVYLMYLFNKKSSKENLLTDKNGL